MTGFDMVIILLLVFYGLLILYPFYNSFLVSLVPQNTYTKTPFMLWPSEIDLKSYQFIFLSKKFWSGYRVTSIVTVVGVLYNMFLTVITAYALSKNHFKGKGLVLNFIIFTMYFSGGLIPYYMLINSLNLTNKIAVMILPTGINTFFMLIMRNFFSAIPKSLVESAKIDGANEIQVLIKIILPVSKPSLATIGLFYAVDRWNEWFNAMLFIRDGSKHTLQLVLRRLISQVQSAESGNIPDIVKYGLFQDGVKMAGVFVTILPIMLLYPLLQKYFMKGIMIGAIKG